MAAEVEEGCSVFTTLPPEGKAQFVAELDSDARSVIAYLSKYGPLSKVELFRSMSYSRHRGDKVIRALEALRLVNWAEHGPAKDYDLTDDGEAVDAHLQGKTWFAPPKNQTGKELEANE